MADFLSLFIYKQYNFISFKINEFLLFSLLIYGQGKIGLESDKKIVISTLEPTYFVKY